jgi:formylglycine-generating enzyme required for sulfatase activity
MKYCTLLAASVLTASSVVAWAEEPAPQFIYESPQEFFASGDFRGQGVLDIVIVDKASGKYRVGYQTAPGTFNWVDCRPSGIKSIKGFAVGKLAAAGKDGLAFAAPDDNQITIVDVSNPAAGGKPVTVPFTEQMGPSLAVGLPGEAGQLSGLYIGSIYNSPDPNQATVLGNSGSDYPTVLNAPLKGVPARGNRLALKTGQPELVCVLLNSEKGAVLQAESVSGGKAVTVAEAADLPAGADYTVGNFGGSPLRDFVFYKPGTSNLIVRPVEEPAAGQFAFGKGEVYDLGEPISRVVTLGAKDGPQLLVIFAEGERAGVFKFDGKSAPSLAQSIAVPKEQISWAASLPGGFVLFSHTPGGKFSTRYQIFDRGTGNYVAGRFGALASLADNDNITIPDIYARIVAAATVKSESEMKAYTNTIPGTQVTYAMVPIPSGEYLMGSPETEAGRKADEGPQHKVKISPFWMGQQEVTWNEYELFMYPEEERRTRVTLPTDPAGDKLADAVTHPSKPYVEMSFGMGKDGYPAIAMTQHAANKYCQWLSAKTGHFYRLPTEAEWEYAARAGTTTKYFFGDDDSKLGEYAWYEQNSDFKYQKVGKKKPNPWGLYDIYGNVVEWVLDQYDPDFYKQSAGPGESVDPWNKATKPYPHSVRGGSWDDEAGLCRSAARRGSDRSWKMQDPQLPKSIWYFSDSQIVGFRFVRPLQVPTAEQMQKYWTSGVERD